jgi:GntR family transcriptional regulator, negative regulator for fad regulon and positive regulator of fabA
MVSRTPPQRPAAYAEEALVSAILRGTYPPGSTLLAERQLAEALGVTRPTLREALQRLSRDGWVSIRQGKPTLVNDYRRDGGLNVLTALVPDLLEVRCALAPAYTRQAVARNRAAVLEALAGAETLPDTSRAFAGFDWALHRALTLASGNTIYTLILNGFAGFYEQMARRYFARPEARAASRAFYGSLRVAAEAGDAALAGRVTEPMMTKSLALWTSARKPSAR